MARWIWILMLLWLLAGCATGADIERRATQDEVPGGGDGLPCFFFRW